MLARARDGVLVANDGGGCSMTTRRVGGTVCQQGRRVLNANEEEVLNVKKGVPSLALSTPAPNRYRAPPPSLILSPRPHLVCF